MFCHLCGHSKVEAILEKPAIPIYTNASDEDRKDNRLYSCCLNQCLECGHVFQPISKEIRNALETVYLSEYAQITTPLGTGNWGKERASYYLNKLGKIDQYKRKSILEIGCGNGYVLKELKKAGFRDLVGIEPSIQKTQEIDGILFLKEFITAGFTVKRKFDFIFSFGVFEHVDDINNLISFIKKHLNDGGELFVEVPNCLTQLNSGDPAVFCHEHAHCFYKESLCYLLADYGFEVVEDRSDDHSLVICAKKTQANKVNSSDAIFFNEFQTTLENNLIRTEENLNGNNVIVHGACNSLHNILNWSGNKSDFTLVDSDTTKHGKTFFNKKVHSIDSVGLEAFDTVLIVPDFFSDAIKLDYERRGFNGRVDYIT